MNSLRLWLTSLHEELTLSSDHADVVNICATSVMLGTELRPSAQGRFTKQDASSSISRCEWCSCFAFASMLAVT